MVFDANLCLSTFMMCNDVQCMIILCPRSSTASAFGCHQWVSDCPYRTALLKGTRSFESSNERTNKNHCKRTSNGSNSFAFTVWIRMMSFLGLLGRHPNHFQRISRGFPDGLESAFMNCECTVRGETSAAQSTNYRLFFEGIGLLACLIMSGPCRRVRVSWWIVYDPSWCFGHHRRNKWRPVCSFLRQLPDTAPGWGGSVRNGNLHHPCYWRARGLSQPL